jgi:hypothetical protein
MHKIVVIALLVRKARTEPFTVIHAVFLLIFVFFFKKLAFKTLNDQFFIKNALILDYATIRALLTFPC